MFFGELIFKSILIHIIYTGSESQKYMYYQYFITYTVLNNNNNNNSN